MSSYYYFAATLPSLRIDGSAPMTLGEFLERAGRYLSPKDLFVLEGARLYIPEDGSFPLSAASSPLLMRYYRWELALRNELTRLRAQRLQRPADKHLKPGEPEWDGVKTAQAAFQAEDPLQGELLIERERWPTSRGFRREPLLRYGIPLFLRLAPAGPGAQSALYGRGGRGGLRDRVPVRARLRGLPRRIRRTTMTTTKGSVTGVNGNMVSVRVDGTVSMNEVAYIVLGDKRLKAEVIRVRATWCRPRSSR
jgi:hypothetical protein